VGSPQVDTSKSLVLTWACRLLHDLHSCMGQSSVGEAPAQQ
jgi:hypothetical protein